MFFLNKFNDSDIKELNWAGDELWITCQSETLSFVTLSGPTSVSRRNPIGCWVNTSPVTCSCWAPPAGSPVETWRPGSGAADHQFQKEHQWWKQEGGSLQTQPVPAPSLCTRNMNQSLCNNPVTLTQPLWLQHGWIVRKWAPWHRLSVPQH